MASPIQDRLSNQPRHLRHPELRLTGERAPYGDRQTTQAAVPSALSVTPAKELVIQPMPGSRGGMLPPLGRERRFRVRRHPGAGPAQAGIYIAASS
jgi:hypothetical protein